MADFKKAFALVVLAEGDKFTNDPHDNGGPTRYGVTQKTLSAFLGRQATIEDVQNLKIETAEQVYKLIFWDKMHGDVLPWALALLCFDAAIMSGPQRAVGWMQLAVGALQDGMAGPATLKACNAADLSVAVPRMVTARLMFLKQHEDFAIYGSGWYNRVILKVMQAGQET